MRVACNLFLIGGELMPRGAPRRCRPRLGFAQLTKVPANAAPITALLGKDCPEVLYAATHSWAVLELVVHRQEEIISRTSYAPSPRLCRMLLNSEVPAKPKAGGAKLLNEVACVRPSRVPGGTTRITSA